MATAILNNFAQSPRKVRLVANLVKGKPVEQALEALQFLPKKAGMPVAKLLKSAIANAKNKGENVEGMKVKSVTVENAGVLKRYMPRAMGRASLIHKRRSRVILTIAQ